MSYQQVNVTQYFPSTGSPGLSVAYDGVWNDTSEADSVTGVWSPKSGTSFVTRSLHWNFSLAHNAISLLLARQIILPAFGSSLSTLLAGSLSGTGISFFIPSLIVRAKLIATRNGGSPIGGFPFRPYLVCKVVNSGGTPRYTLSSDYNSSDSVYTGSVMKACNWPATGYRVQWSTGGFLAPNATDRLVLELGFRPFNNLATGTMDFSVSIEFGDSASTDLNTGSISQQNPHDIFQYFIPALGSSNIGGILKPLSPTLDPRRFQSPVIPDRSSDILNEFILN